MKLKLCKKNILILKIEKNNFVYIYIYKLNGRMLLFKRKENCWIKKRWN
jgi:hypothetical protein